MMKPESSKAFEHKDAEASDGHDRDNPPVIRAQMNRSDWLIMLVLALIWGSAFLFISVAVHDVPPITYVWLRLTIAAATLWLFLKARGQPIHLPRQVWGAIVVLAVLNNAVPFVLIGWGEIHIASGLAAILNATTPIWGVVIAHFLTHDERMSPRKVVGVLIGFAGVVVMMGPELLTNLNTGVIAQLACVIASLSYALAAVWARRFREQGISPLAVTTGQLTAGAAVMLPVSIIIDRPWTHALPSPGAWASIGMLAVVCSAVAYLLYFRLIERAGATNALLVTLVVPPVAIVFGALFLGEILAPQDFAGLGLIAIGLAAIDGRLLNLLSRRRPPQAA